MRILAISTLSILILALTVLGPGMAGFMCRTPPPGPAVGNQGENSPGDEGDHCGACLDFPNADVCTARGTMRNSCLAICTGEKILCARACPCPAE